MIRRLVVTGAEEGEGKIDRRADRGAANKRARGGGERRGESMCVRGVADDAPIDHELLLALACRFNIGERDLAVRAGRDRAQELLALDRGA